MPERISAADKSFVRGYANHIQRYQFAERYCAGRKVLDAGCGIGYGSYHLAFHGAGSVVAVDISDEALAEADRLFKHDALRFLKADVEHLTALPELAGPFDVVVNLENIEHLNNASQFVAEARKVIADDGVLVVSSPNVSREQGNPDGPPSNPFHVKEFTVDEFGELLGREFGSVEMFGQWDTPERLARLDFELRLHELLCESYYSPYARLWRSIRRLAGKRCVPPPEFSGAGTSFPWESTIHPIAISPYPWESEVILAVCRP